MLNDFLQVTLGAFRIGAFLASMPLFATTPIPPQIKVFLSLVLSYMMLPFLSPLPAGVLEQNTTLFLVIVREISIGVFIGFGVRLLFMIMTLTLEFAGLQMGFSIANILDPQGSEQVSMLAALGVNLLLLYLMSINFHHDLFLILGESYQKLPMGLPDFQMQEMLGRMAQSMTDIFRICFQLAFPIVFAMFAIHLVLAVITKTAPQMNLFFNITFVINIVCGLLLVNLSWTDIFSQIQIYSRHMAESGYNLW